MVFGVRFDYVYKQYTDLRLETQCIRGNLFCKLIENLPLCIHTAIDVQLHQPSFHTFNDRFSLNKCNFHKFFFINVLCECRMFHVFLLSILNTSSYQARSSDSCHLRRFDIFCQELTDAIHGAGFCEVRCLC